MIKAKEHAAAMSSGTTHEPYLVVDCNSQQVAAAVSRVLIDALDLGPQQACTFALLWELRSADLAPLMR